MTEDERDHGRFMPGRPTEAQARGGAAATRKNQETARELADATLRILEGDDSPEARNRLQKALVDGYATIASKAGAKSTDALAQLAAVGGALAVTKMQPPAAMQDCPLCGRRDPMAPIMVDGTGLPWLRRMLLDNIEKCATLVADSSPEVNRICREMEEGTHGTREATTTCG